MLCERQKVFFWGAYTRGGGGLIFGWAYIRVEKRVTNLGALYSEELIHGEGGTYLRNFTVYFAENTKVHENCKIKNLLRD